MTHIFGPHFEQAAMSTLLTVASATSARDRCMLGNPFFISS